MSVIRQQTTEEWNAAFDAVHEELEELIAAFVPPFFKRQAMDKLNSPEGRRMVLNAVDKALDAAQEVREREEAKKAP